MKKQFLNLGKALNKAEQKSINGGTLKDDDYCRDVADEYNTWCCLNLGINCSNSPQ